MLQVQPEPQCHGGLMGLDAGVAATAASLPRVPRLTKGAQKRQSGLDRLIGGSAKQDSGLCRREAHKHAMRTRSLSAQGLQRLWKQQCQCSAAAVPRGATRSQEPSSGLSPCATSCCMTMPFATGAHFATQCRSVLCQWSATLCARRCSRHAMKPCLVGRCRPASLAEGLGLELIQ